MNQRQMVLQYMKDYGSITSYQAYIDLGITQLSTRISELREQGYIFTYDWIIKKNRYGKKVRFKRYILEEINENRNTFIDKTEKELTKDLVQS